MAFITFEVTGKAQVPGRLNTIQDFELKIISKFVKPPINFNRSHAFSQDMKTVQGTLVSSSETFQLECVFSNDEIPAVDELIYSLASYQVAELNGTDIPRFNQVRNFIIPGNDFNFEAVGCYANTLTINGVFLEN